MKKRKKNESFVLADRPVSTLSYNKYHTSDYQSNAKDPKRRETLTQEENAD